MKVTQEKIDIVAMEMYKATSEERKIALRDKLCDMCLHYVVNKEQEADLEGTAQRIEQYSEGGNDALYHCKIKYDNLAFAQAWDEAYRGFNPEKGSFSRYFIKCFTFNLNKANQEKYFYNVSGGIRFDTGMMRRYGEINRIIKELSHEYPVFANKRLNNLTDKEIDLLISIACGGVYEEKLERVINYFKLVSNIYSIDQSYDTDDGEHKIEIEDKNSKIVAVEEDALPRLVEIMKQVFWGTTNSHKKYYSCFNMGAVVSEQEILAYIEENAEYLEWLLWKFVANRRNIELKDVEAIKNIDISEYMQKDKGTISRQQKNYQRDFGELLKKIN